MSRIKSFSPVNPTGDTPGMEPVRLDVLRAAIENKPDAMPTHRAEPPPPPVVEVHPVAVAVAAAPAPVPPSAAIPLVNKNIRLPADLVDYIDFVYTKEKRLKKQDAYTHALELFFRPLMPK